MEVYHWVLCCLLVATAACSRELDAIPEQANVSQPLDTNNQNCTCENGDCFTDNLGNPKCVCKSGFALQGEFTCKPCDCGSLGQCIFVLTVDSSTPDDEYRYDKKCVCDVGTAEKDGVCVDCFCGKYSSCDFDQGERNCYCIEGYSEKDGVCTKCDCGFNGECEYEDGHKKCECDEGYLEVNGKCEECDCGSNSENCEFVDGVKQCECNEGYADRYGTCEECDCGNHTVSCNFNDNQKTCRCLEGYVQKGEMCEPGCSSENPCLNGGYCKEGLCFCHSGTRGEICETIDECPNLCPNQSDVQCAYDSIAHKAFCRCLDDDLSYDPDTKKCKKSCQDNGSCKNQGKCTGTSQLKFCDCLEGTTGDLCEKIPVCNGIHCGPDAQCVFNPSTKKGDCACRNSSQYYDSTTGRCRWGCDKDNECLNGGKCVANGTRKICDCLSGTEGDRCEIVNDCASGHLKCSGSSAYCSFDVKTRKATCECKNDNEMYDFKLGACRYFCMGPEDCLNGGRCVDEGFCKCWSRTHGARCEIIDDCYYGRITCRGSDAYCTYDRIFQKGTCACKNPKEFYSFWFGRCKRRPFTKKDYVEHP